MFRKLRLQLTVVCSLCTSLVLIIMAAASFNLSANQLRNQYQQRFDSSMNGIYYVLRTQPVMSHAWLLETEAAENLWIRIQNEGNQLLFTAKNSIRERLTLLAGETARRDYQFDPLMKPLDPLSPESIQFPLNEDGRYHAAVSRLTTDNGWLSVIVLQDRESENTEIQRLMFLFTVCVLASSGCLVLFSWVFTGYVVRPISESKKQQNEFIHAASHEFRAPLTVLRVSAEGVQTADSLEAAKQYGEIMLRECVRASRLSDDLLRLAGSDSRMLTMRPIRLNPDVLVISAIETYARTARENAISLRADIPEERLPEIFCDPGRMEQVLAILMDNAIQYTPEGGQISVSVRAEKRHVVLKVSDSGSGIPDAEKPFIFDRFYQADHSRTNKEHFGLGLSIAKEIVGLHKGQLLVGDSVWGGAEFTVKLPVG